MRSLKINCLVPGELVYFIDNNKICKSFIDHVYIKILVLENEIYYMVINFEGDKVYLQDYLIFSDVEKLLSELEYDFKNDL